MLDKELELLRNELGALRNRLENLIKRLKLGAMGMKVGGFLRIRRNPKDELLSPLTRKMLAWRSLFQIDRKRLFGAILWDKG